MLGYINKISSLEEKASARVAINLCQENGFKEVALNLEKPTYGCFISVYGSSVSRFISDPQKLSIWAKVKENNRLRDAFVTSYFFNDTEEMKARQWDTAVDEQCQRLMEGIPNQFKQTIHPWINHIALEYLSYSRRQEKLFGVSRYFLMNIFTREDWKETARLDEKKLAQRLLEDERLTVLQRYCIACVYCLHIHIFQLWERLTQKEKWFASKGEKYHRLVLFWSRYMEKKVPWQKIDLQKAVTHAVNYGNYAALMMCWNAVSGNALQMFVIDRALQSLRQYQSVGGFHVNYNQLLSYQSPESQCDFVMKYFNLPSYYTELIFFFLSRMDEEEQLTFFKASFESKYCYQGEYYSKSVLECYLEWPHQDGFLLTINKLWGIIPKDKYVQCLLALAHKYSDTKANRFYDYRSLLRALWEETPEEYQQYVFHYKNPNYPERNGGVKLLSQLLERSPFQEKDEALFKRIFHDQPQEKRRAMMRSTEGEYMCLSLMRKEKWSFLNELLVECLSKEGIPGFKKRFMQSTFSVKLALDVLKENRGKVVEDLLDWSLESEAEKTQCKDQLKYALINGKPCLDECQFLLLDGKFAEVEHMINFCLSSDEKKEQFKKRFAQCACGVLVRDFRFDQNWSKDYATGPFSIGSVLEQMDTIIAWSVDTEEKKRDFKKDLFSRKRIDIRDRIVLPEEL